MKKNLLKNPYDVILHPVVTEKSTLASESNTVTFKVSLQATKTQIADAVKKIYDVDVEKVNTLIRKGKQVRFKGKLGKHSDSKKAMVRVKKGQHIDLGAGV